MSTACANINTHALNDTRSLSDDWYVTWQDLHRVDNRSHTIIEEVFQKRRESRHQDQIWYLYIYVNRFSGDGADMTGYPSNAFILCHHVRHFIISFPPIYRRSQNTFERRNGKNKERKMMVYSALTCVYRWPIDMKYMYIVHIGTNQILLSYGCNRLAKRREREREK